MAARTSSPYAHVKRGKDNEFGIYFRSQYELIVARALTLMGWEWEYEPREFWFDGIKRGVRHYRPDFLARSPEGEEKWIEVKGWLNREARTKLKRFAKYYPDEAKKLVIVTDSPSVRNWVVDSFPRDVCQSVEFWSLRKLRKWAAIGRGL